MSMYGMSTRVGLSLPKGLGSDNSVSRLILSGKLFSYV